MNQELITALSQSRTEAVRVLGLPTESPITHTDVERAYERHVRFIREPVAREALDLVRKLAHSFVYTRGWRYDTTGAEDVTEWLAREIDTGMLKGNDAEMTLRGNG